MTFTRQHFDNQARKAAFQQEGATMTRDEFIAYASEYLFGEASHSLCEMIAEMQNEINMFGDSGPGSALRLREILDDYNKIANQYERLTGRKVQRHRMPVWR